MRFVPTLSPNLTRVFRESLMPGNESFFGAFPKTGLALRVGTVPSGFRVALIASLLASI